VKKEGSKRDVIFHRKKCIAKTECLSVRRGYRLEREREREEEEKKALMRQRGDRATDTQPTYYTLLYCYRYTTTLLPPHIVLLLLLNYYLLLVPCIPKISTNFTPSTTQENISLYLVQKD